MHEVLVITHVHSYLSDGHATYQEIADAACDLEIDGVIITDHNVFIEGKESFFEKAGKKVIILSGQEIHDQSRNPQKNHLLVFNPTMDFSLLAHDQARHQLTR